MRSINELLLLCLAPLRLTDKPLCRACGDCLHSSLHHCVCRKGLAYRCSRPSKAYEGPVQRNESWKQSNVGAQAAAGFSFKNCSLALIGLE